MSNYPRAILALTALFISFSVTASAEEWSRFRGPNGSGISNDSGFPVAIGPDENLVWKAPVRQGKSSPVLTERHVFLAAFEDETLYTQCFDRHTGELLWERAEERTREQVLHSLNEPASVTPVTDGENVYIFFRDLGLISYNAEGERRWITPLGPFTNYEGLSASPVIADGLLILLVDQRGGSYIAAFDVRDGELKWKTSRDAIAGWATPLVHRPVGGPAQVVTAAYGRFNGYLLSNGKETWMQPGLSPAVVASPILVGNTVYAFGYGYDSPMPYSEALAEADKDGDGGISAEEAKSNSWIYQVGLFKGDRDGAVTKEEWDEAFAEIVAPSSLVALELENVNRAGAPMAVQPRQLWRYERSFVGVVPSPLLYEDVLYIQKNGGILTAIDAGTGEVAKRGRIREALGDYFASPVAAEGKIYLVSQEGKVSVLRAGRDWEILSVNELDEPCYATPALSAGRVFVRTDESLYCFGTPRSRTALR